MRLARAIGLCATAFAAFAACVDLGGLSGSGPAGATDGGGDDGTLGADHEGQDGTSNPGSDAAGDGPVDDADASVPPGDAACPLRLDAGPDGAPAAVYLAAGESAPSRIATDYATVFWTSGSGSSAKIRSCTATGCNGTPSTVTGFNRAYGYMTVDGTNVYWTDGYTPGTVFKCPKTGCADASPILGSLYAPNGIASDGTNVFWTLTGSGIIGTCAGPACATTSDLASTESNPRRIAVDGTTVFWMNDSGLVRFCAKSGCGGTPGSLAAGQHVPGEGAMALDATTVYWADNPSATVFTINSCLKAGCSLAPTVAVPGLTSAPRDIVADGGNLYWIDANSLKTCPVAGCAVPQTILTLTGPQGLALDARQGCASALYWVESGGAVRKLVL